MSKKILVEIKNYSKSFVGKEVNPLLGVERFDLIKNFDLDIFEGEFVTILGSSGCGKTTILRAISGMDLKHGGQIIIDGVDVTNFDPTKRPVNTIFQNYSLFTTMNVEKNIGFGLKMKKVPKKEIEKRVKAMLELVHLEGYEKRMSSQLSGGEQQRVAIARALINNPKVLLLDEPLSALDLKLRKEMQLELKKLQKRLGITFIYVTHNQDEALTMSDRIVLLHNGKIEQVDTPQNIYEKPKTFYVADFIGDSNIFSGIISKANQQTINIILNNGIIIKGINNDFEENTKVKIIVRPENIYFGKIKDNDLEVKIKDFIYDGLFTKVLVEKDGKEISIVTKKVPDNMKKNDIVYITFDMQDMIILKDL